MSETSFSITACASFETRRGVGEVFALLGCYAANVVSCLPTFRTALQSTRAKVSDTIFDHISDEMGSIYSTDGNWKCRTVHSFSRTK